MLYTAMCVQWHNRTISVSSLYCKHWSFQNFRIMLQRLFMFYMGVTMLESSSTRAVIVQLDPLDFKQVGLRCLTNDVCSWICSEYALSPDRGGGGSGGTTKLQV